MKGIHCLHHAAVAASVLLVSSPFLGSTLRADTCPAEVPFAQPWPGAVVVPVTLNGMGPYSFLIDTGSSHTAVSSRLAAQLEAPRVAKTQISSSSGTQWTAVVALAHVVAGPLAMHDVLATELPTNAVVNSQAVDGVLGRDVLEQQPFTIDYRRQLLRWSIDDDEHERVSLPLDLAGPIWLATLGTGMRLVPDSGATDMVLFDRGQWRGLRHLPGTVGVETVTSRTTGEPGELSQLNIGALRFVNQGVTVLDGTHVSSAHGDGLLPLHWFDRVTFDIAHSRLVLSRARSGRTLASVLREPGVQTE